MSKRQYDSAKKRLGAVNEAQAEDKAKAVEAPVMDEILVASKFRNRLKQNTYKLQDGLIIEYRALLPIDFQTFRGSALSARMIEDGFTLENTQNIQNREQYAESLPRLVRSQLMVEAAKDAIIHAAVNPQFSGFPPDRCPADKVSIDELTPTEILVFNDAIYKLSGGDLAEERFRQSSEADAVDRPDEADASSEGEHVDDSVDCEGVQSESV